MYAWQFSKMLSVSQANGWTRFVSMQNHLNLLYREEEREMLPLCKSEGIGVIPWSPLARGRLTRDWDAKSDRSETDEIGKGLYTSMTEYADRRVVEAVATIAKERGVPRAQIGSSARCRLPAGAEGAGGEVSAPRDRACRLRRHLTRSEILEWRCYPCPRSGAPRDPSWASGQS